MPKSWQRNAQIRMPPEWRPYATPPSHEFAWLSGMHSAYGEAYTKTDPPSFRRPHRPCERRTYRVSEPIITTRPARGRPIAVFDGANPYLGNAGWFGATLGFAPLWWARPHNEAWAKLVEQLKGEDTPELLVLAGEAREGLTMIASRLGWIRSCYKELRRGNFRGFIKRLGVPPLRQHRKWMNKKEYYRSGRRAADIARNASGLWLEYWFGWAPTVSDISNTLEVLTGEHAIYTDPAPAWGSSWMPLSPEMVSMGSWEWANVLTSGRIRVRQGVLYTVENPNLFLLNKLGLVNLPAAMWELLPFSFVVDWFFKLGNVLDSFTDFVGLKIHSSYTSVSVKFSALQQTGDPYGGSITYPIKGVRMRRSVGNGATGLTRPVILNPVRLDTVWGPLNRARTISALVTQLFLADAISGRGRN